jgi:hypothetical protein
VITPTGGTFNNAINVTLTDAAPSVSIYYTLDGTTPTTNSALYTGPFVLTNNAWLQAIAAQTGNANSAAASANFAISVPSRPRLTSIRLSGSTLALTATNGPAARPYVLLMSTNAALPLSQWTPALTNTFDSNGNLNLTTNIISPGDTQKFYILLIQ